jgi:Na+/H+ antiporter NhaD/arsenite permease-like protein
MSQPVRRLLLLTSLFLPALQHGLAGDGQNVPVEPLMIAPFILLLLAIAIVPFINRHWWEKNYPTVAIGLGLIVIGYYLFVLQNPVRMMHVGTEYVSFIVLIGSLFVVAGGIHIKIRGRSTPQANLLLLLVGAVLSNVVGTTGASMILIRPYLRVNRYRIKPFHVVFFIFIVSNMGGALTPIGDPPLFLGYLQGIPFFWVAETVWFKWLVAMAIILGVFFALDYISYRRLPARERHEAEAKGEEGEVSGISNAFYLAIILVAVFISRPLFVREVLMLGAAAGSYFTTRKEIHEKNAFNFLPIKEVGILFLGIFATMVPALDWLEMNSDQIGIHSVGQFYWATGLLSSVLDNAPTYLNFLSAQIGLFADPELVRNVQHLIQARGPDLAQALTQSSPEVRDTFALLFREHYGLVASGNVPERLIMVTHLLAHHELHVQAISLAAVFFGACTYIGNGPNFMVKAIAEHSGVQTPSFFGYVARYTLPVLLPIFLVIWFLFFRA